MIIAYKTNGFWMQIPLIEILAFPIMKLNILIGGKHIQETLQFISPTEFFETKVTNGVRFWFIKLMILEHDFHFVKYLLNLTEY